MSKSLRVNHSEGHICDLLPGTSAFIRKEDLMVYPYFDVWAVETSVPKFSKRNLADNIYIKLTRTTDGNFQAVLPRRTAKRISQNSPFIADLFSEKRVFIKVESFTKDWQGVVKPLSVPSDKKWLPELQVAIKESGFQPLKGEALLGKAGLSL